MQDKLGILLIIGGMTLFSIQDVTIKALAQDGSLLQILVMRGSLEWLLFLRFFISVVA